MTIAESPFAAEDAVATEAPPGSVWLQRWLKAEAWLDRMGDRLNPILVKEARQAMKSRQFVVTFSLLLIFGWLFTLAFIAFTLPGLYYAPLGSSMLLGYYLILSIPLLIVVPYAAFRSLASEREDGTFELLSITALTARQIVTGKLGSAILQMMVYYSALAPCIAFTYLLRGIDVVTIALFLIYTFLASLMLCVVGLMLATVTRSRHWQVVLSVVFVMALLAFAVFWDMASIGILVEGGAMPYDEPDFWVFNVGLLSFYSSFVALFLLVAAGQLTFASENRSTRLRIVLLVQQTLIVGWGIYGWLRVGVIASSEARDTLLMTTMAWLGAYWAVTGSFLTGEAAELSPRAKRQLPQTLVGRMAFTWFNPGSGTGYVFAMLNLAAATLVLVACALVDLLSFSNGGRVIFWCLAIWGYVAGYLGVVRLLIVLARRYTYVSMLAAYLCQMCMVILGLAVPIVIQAFISWGNIDSFEYSVLQLPNWAWTLYEIANNSWMPITGLALSVFGLGMLVYVANLLVAAREVEQVRQAAPQRVLEDEATLHPPTDKVVALSPWDK